MPLHRETGGVSPERRSLTAPGHLAYRLKTPDDTTPVVFETLDCALPMWAM